MNRTDTKKLNDLYVYINHNFNYIVMILFIIVISICNLYLYNQNNALYTQNNNLINNNSQLNNIISNNDSKYNELESKYKRTYDLLCSTLNLVDSSVYLIQELNNENKELVNLYNQINNELNTLYDRVELFDKYEYAIMYNNKRTDITYDQLILAEQVAEEHNLDPNLLLGIIMIESNGNEDVVNKSSGATGYAQFIYSTGKYVYEVLMGNGRGTYTSEIAKNGDISIEMMGYYFEYLLQHYDSLYVSLKSYCGDSSNNGNFTKLYMKKIDEYISENITISEIANNINTN